MTERVGETPTGSEDIAIKHSGNPEKSISDPIDQPESEFNDSMVQLDEVHSNLIEEGGEKSPQIPVGPSEENIPGKQNQDSRSPHPFVHWSQTETNIRLRVELIEARELKYNLSDNGTRLEFSTQGIGAQGLRDYAFELQLLDQCSKVNCQQTDSSVLITLEKGIKSDSLWPRLTQVRQKLPWLRVDFSRFITDDSSDSENDFREEFPSHLDSPPTIQKNRDTLSDAFQKNIFNPFHKELPRQTREKSAMAGKYRTMAADNSRNIARHALDMRKTYLFLYNILLFIMFLMVYLVLVIKCISGTIGDDTVKGAALIIKVLTYTQLLETIHPILGLVPGGPFMPFLQVLGRLIVNSFLADPSIRIGSYPFAHYLFIVWSSIEIFRYSFYALRVFKVDIFPLTWCRYTLFIPLYPMGALCETLVVVSAIKTFEKTGAYSIGLPNAANFAFNMPTFLRIYIVLLAFSVYYLMRYMWSQRVKQLKPKTD